MQITEDNEPFPGVQLHFGGVMSDGGEFPNFTPDYTKDCFGVEACPASCGRGRSAAAPANATASGAAATQAPSFSAV